jgi:hypothetical protein
MDDQKRELTPEELALAEEAWLNCDRQTAIISAAFGLIVATRAESWVPWVEANDLGIPYSLGIEMGDIEENGLSPKGLSVVDIAYRSLCEKLGVENISSVKELHNLMINSGRGLPEEEVEEEVED